MSSMCSFDAWSRSGRWCLRSQWEQVAMELAGAGGVGAVTNLQLEGQQAVSPRGSVRTREANVQTRSFL